MEFVMHNGSACQGKPMAQLFGAPRGEYIHYNAVGFDFIGGRHMLHALAYCAKEPKCGGMSVDPLNACTYWWQVDDFSSARDDNSTFGWRCVEKRVIQKTKASDLSGESEEKLVGLVDQIWKSGLLKLSASASNCISNLGDGPGAAKKTQDITSKANDYAQQIQELNDNFGMQFVAPSQLIALGGHKPILLVAPLADDALAKMNVTVDELVAEFGRTCRRILVA